MKNVIFTALVLFVTVSWAQKPNVEKPKKPNFTPEQHAELKAKKMALALELNDDQFEKVYALELKQAQNFEVKMAMRESRKEKGEKPSDEEIFQMKKEFLDNQLAVQKEMKKILNEEQFDKWMETRQKNAEKPRGERKHFKKSPEKK